MFLSWQNHKSTHKYINIKKIIIKKKKNANVFHVNKVYCRLSTKIIQTPLLGSRTVCAVESYSQYKLAVKETKYETFSSEKSPKMQYLVFEKKKLRQPSKSSSGSKNQFKKKKKQCRQII